MLKYKKYIFLTLIVLFVFVSLTNLSPMLKEVPLNLKEYTLNNAHMNIRHKPPLFELKENGVYFIHPALEKEAKAVFSFENNEKQLWYFSIQEGSKVGKILFTIKKNDDEIHKFMLDTKNDAKIQIDVNKNDQIAVIANCAQSAAGDWGNLKIYKYEPYYILKLRLLALVWILFFIYLINKGYIIIAFSSYFGFILALIAEKLTYNALDYIGICAYTATFFLLGFVSTLLYQELQKFQKFKIATLIIWTLKIMIFSIPLFFILFFLIFEKPIDWNILFAVYQTSPVEAIGFIESFIPLNYLLIFVTFLILIAYVLIQQENKDKQPIERSVLLMIIIVLMGFVSINLWNARIPNLINTSLMDYNSQIEHLKNFQKKRKASKVKFNATKDKKGGEVHVVVLGESLNKYTMGTYGYFKDTTPKQIVQVKHSDLIVFNNAYSNSGNTMQSLSLALTEANQYNGKSFLDSLSFVDIFNKAGFDTVWISNQSILNDTNTIVSALASSAKNIVDMGETFKSKLGLTTHYDENVLAKLKEYMKQERNTLIVIHLYGNHYKYKDRYPSKYSKFSEIKPYMIGTNKAYILDDYRSYINSVYYNDYVVSEILNIVKKRGGVSSFMYFSDHGEDIVRHRGHTARPESFNMTMTQIPLSAWLSPAYIKQYPEKYQSLLAHKESLFSNDMIYDTIIGVADIKTDRYGATYDLSSRHYSLTPKEALTLHGKVHYTTEDNYYYWRKYNSTLLTHKTIKKMVINEITTVGKLNEAWSLGYRSFKIDLKYLETKKEFIINPTYYKARVSLTEFLHSFKIDEVENIFLNITKIDMQTFNNIIHRLEEINKKLAIKNKVKVILKDSKFAKQLQNKGWSAVLEKSVENKMINTEDVILNTSDNNNMLDILIHSNMNLADSQFSNRLKDMKGFDTPVIKYILVDFKSEFDE